MKPFTGRDASGRTFIALVAGYLLFFLIPSSLAQVPLVAAHQPPPQASPALDEVSPVAARVEVEPVAGDDQIRERLERILTATGWFIKPSIRVEAGAGFLRGCAESHEHKKWARKLARKAIKEPARQAMEADSREKLPRVSSAIEPPLPPRPGVQK